MAARLLLVVFLISFSVPSTVWAGPIVFAAGGTTLTSSIQGTVDAFRAALGNPNNANTAGPLGSGRREINWDGGGGVDVTAIAGTPFTAFLNIRGAEFVTPGTGFVQAPQSGGPQGGLATLFNNATYASIFSTFSPLRLFAPIGSNLTDVLFFIPGTNGSVPATVSGFGAVFTDVDLANSTSLQFFDVFNNSLGIFNVPASTVASGGLSFLGVTFDAGERVGRVRIISGNAALGPNDGAGTDVVAMDDFIFSEPVAAAIPEPSTMLLLGGGVMVFAAMRRRGRSV